MSTASNGAAASNSTGASHQAAAAPSRSAQLDVATLQRPNPFDILRFQCPEHPDAAAHILIGREGPAVTMESNSMAKRVAVVASVGASQCLSVCMQRYAQCAHPAHRCIRRCHVALNFPIVSLANVAATTNACQEHNNEEEEEDEDHFHQHCPYPCPKTLPCGHRCLSTCDGDEPCPPCGFVGWVPLPCGQLVVSGMNGKEVSHNVFHHFIKFPCNGTSGGDADLLQQQACDATVHVPCGRCGAKVHGRCVDIENAAEWHCASCDAEAAKVRAEFDLPPAPNMLDDEQQDAAAPIEWPQAAIDKLEKQMSFLRTKNLLLEKRTALEAAAKGPERNPEFVSETQRVAEVHKEQAALEAGWVQCSADAKAHWAAEMKVALEGHRGWKDLSEVLHRQVVDVVTSRLA